MRSILRRHKKAENSDGESSSESIASPGSTSPWARRSNVTPSSTDSTDWALLCVQTLKDISEASQALKPLKAACALLERALEIAHEKTHKQVEWGQLVETIDQQKRQLASLAGDLERTDRIFDSTAHDALATYLGVVQNVLEQAMKPTKQPRSRLSKLLQHASPLTATKQGEVLVASKTYLNDAYQGFTRAMTLATVVRVDQALASINQILNDEFDHIYAAYEGEDNDEDSPYTLLYGIDKPICQLGTRVQVLASIRHWAEDDSKQSRIYWLNDAAGTGKTTVAATLAKEWRSNNQLAARFFFTPNLTMGSGISELCRVLSKDIANHFPSLEGMIADTIKKLESQSNSFDDKFRQLLVLPLNSVKEHHLIILDALDNCDSIGRTRLLQNLLEWLPNMPRTKVLITSRPLLDIFDVLSRSRLVHEQEIQLLDIHDTVRADVSLYVQKSLPGLSTQQHELVVDYSGGLFLIAATTCSMLRSDRRPASLLKKLLDADSMDHLDHLYLEILRQALSDPLDHDVMMEVLQVIIIAFQPISINTIKALLPQVEGVDDFVQDLNAIMKDGHPDRPIKVLHPTFREFLMELDRANGFLVNRLSSHFLMAIGCLEILDKTLEYDILGVRPLSSTIPRNEEVLDSQKRIKERTSAALRYACTYWAFHAAEAIANSDVWSKTVAFLQRRFLNWLEIMSWGHELPVCLQGLTRLRIGQEPASFSSPDPPARSFASIMSQAHQFLSQFQSLIQDSALHVYTSAIGFTPTSIPLLDAHRDMYASQVPKIISTNPIIWHACDVLTGHSRRLRRVSFTMDGSRLGSLSEDGVFILWDTTSSANIASSKSHEIIIAAFCFSLDGKMLALATKGSKVHIWDTVSGRRLHNSFAFGEGTILQVSFIPRTTRIMALLSQLGDDEYNRRNLVKIWDFQTRVSEPDFFVGGHPVCFNISPDSSQAVFMTRESSLGEAIGIISIWDLNLCREILRYSMGTTADLPSVTFSPRGDRFATWDRCGRLYLRDGVTGEEVASIRTEMNVILGARFSNQGTTLVYHGTHNNAFLLDAMSGSPLVSLIGHSGSVSHVYYSEDGRSLATVSHDQTIRVWDTTSGQGLRRFFKGYIGAIHILCLSPKWTKLVTVSRKNQINLYGADLGEMQGAERPTPFQVDFAVPRMAFSPTGERMACGYMHSREQSLHLWSTRTGEKIGEPMGGHTGGITALAFSPNGSLVASVSEDGTMRIWDGYTGVPVGQPLLVDGGRIRDFSYDGYVSFSYDGSLVACCTSSSIEVWDVQTRIQTWAIKLSYCSPTISFSPKSFKLAGGANDRAHVWDVKTPASLAPTATSPPGHRPNQACLTKGDTLLVSACNGAIELWTVAESMEHVTSIPFTSQKGFRLGTSLDERYISFGSCVWDISDSSQNPAPVTDIRFCTRRDNFPLSLLSCQDQWVHYPRGSGRLFPIPSQYSGFLGYWFASGTKLVIIPEGRVPLLIDCAPILSG